MRSRINETRLSSGTVAALLALAAASTAADAPSPKLALTFRPVQKDVEYETPPAADVDRCKVDVERAGKGSGWVVLGPAGQVLRRFVDTNGDNVVDQWRYYQHGLEVYRDMDTNFNNKVDQSRWLNTGGSRWGIDANEDGRIDSWKILSAEEATQVAVQALISRDEQRLSTVLFTADDARELGLNAELSRQILDAVGEPGKKLADVLARSKTLGATSVWRNFDSASPPALIPSEDGKAARDLTVYTQALAIVETGGKPGFVQIGEMVRVGDVWKLTQIPRTLEGTTAQVTVSSVLMQPAVGAGAATRSGAVSPEMQQLLKQLQELDEKAPAPSDGRAALVRYNTQRAELLQKLVDQSQSDEDRAQWTRQMVDGLASAVQTGSYGEGVARLAAIETELKKTAADSPLAPYVTYRRLLAEYYHRLQQAQGEERSQVQAWWLEQLEAFTQAHPQAEDTPEAMWQLAVAQEFSGKLPEARAWYGKLSAGYAQSSAGARAAGALRRLDLPGKPLELAGPGLDRKTLDLARYRGKVVLVAFWATWCQPCTEELPQLLELYKQHQAAGFEIVGVNLDVDAGPIAGFLAQHKVPWPHIHEPGGLAESGPGQKFGIITLPTLFLLDQQGVVVSASVSVGDLKAQVPELLKK